MRRRTPVGGRPSATSSVTDEPSLSPDVKAITVAVGVSPNRPSDKPDNRSAGRRRRFQISSIAWQPLEGMRLIVRSIIRRLRACRCEGAEEDTVVMVARLRAATPHLTTDKESTISLSVTGSDSRP